MEMEETQIGRLEHKIEKLKTLGEKSPGVEFMRSEVYSGDHGLAVIEHAPFGVIGAITPVTHSLPTITGNAVSMIAAGNTVVVNPHPSGKRVAAEGVRRFNEAIHRDLGIDNLICVIAEPTLESADVIFKHRDVVADLRHRRAGRGAGRAQQRQTGDRRRTREPAGRGRRNGRPGSGREVDHPRCLVRQQLALHRRKGSVCRRSVCSMPMMQAMERAGAVRLNCAEIDRLTEAAIVQVGEGERQARRAQQGIPGAGRGRTGSSRGPQRARDARSWFSVKRTKAIRSCRSNR